MLEEVSLRLKPLADSHRIELRLGEIEPLHVQGDRERLQRMVSNLVDNAIKYTGAEGRVTLGLQHDSRWASILVSDTGRGIPIEEQEHIFQAFYRTSEACALAERGTGLGLSIAQSITLAHGGTIQVESARQGEPFQSFDPDRLLGHKSQDGSKEQLAVSFLLQSAQDEL